MQTCSRPREMQHPRNGLCSKLEDLPAVLRPAYLSQWTKMDKDPLAFLLELNREPSREGSTCWVEEAAGNLSQDVQSSLLKVIPTSLPRQTLMERRGGKCCSFSKKKRKNNTTRSDNVSSKYINKWLFVYRYFFISL